MSPRGANPKFQAGVELAGIGPVADRMVAITGLSDRIKTADGQPLLTSVHVLHEMKSAIRKYQRSNNPDAVTFKQLTSGIRRGDFPHILAVTAPAFGLPGVEHGAILSSDPRKVQMAKDLHTEAIERARELKEMDLGQGVVIWWPAFDSRRLDVLGQKCMSYEDAWKRMVDFWIEVLKDTNGTVWLEWKPSDPGIDYLCTLGTAIRFCKAVNCGLRRQAMFINNEWAHLLIGGTPVCEGTKTTIEANLFTGFVHVNSAQLLDVSLEREMAKGRSPLDIATGVDWDWAVGMGGRERWDDQQAAVAVLDSCCAAIYAEHDINPAGQDPVKFAELSIHNLEEMLSNVR